MRIDSSSHSPSVSNNESLSYQRSSISSSTLVDASPLPDRLSALFGNFISHVEGQRAQDRAAGIGVFTGANKAGDAAIDGLVRFLLERALTGGSLRDIGAVAQEAVRGGLLQEAKEGLGHIIARSETLSSIADFFGVKFGGSALEAAGSGSSATSALSGGAGKILGGVGAAYSAYELFSNWGKLPLAASVTHGATAGAYIGSTIFPGVGTAIGAGIGAIVGGISSLFGGGKSADQKARDSMRSVLQERGIIDQNWSIGLANGQRFDIGKDGGATLQNVDGSTRKYYDVDFKNPLAADVVAMLDPLGAAVTGGNRKLQTDLVGYLTNAALSNASTKEEAVANVRAIMQQFGVR